MYHIFQHLHRDTQLRSVIKKKTQNNSLNLNISPDLQESEAEVARGSEKALDLNLQLIENIVERMSQYPKLSMYRKVIQTIVS